MCSVQTKPISFVKKRTKKGGKVKHRQAIMYYLVMTEVRPDIDLNLEMQFLMTWMENLCESKDRERKLVPKNRAKQSIFSTDAEITILFKVLG